MVLKNTRAGKWKTDARENKTRTCAECKHEVVCKTTTSTIFTLDVINFDGAVTA
jgi:hypothetical protein